MRTAMITRFTVLGVRGHGPRPPEASLLVGKKLKRTFPCRSDTPTRSNNTERAQKAENDLKKKLIEGESEKKRKMRERACAFFLNLLVSHAASPVFCPLFCAHAFSEK